MASDGVYFDTDTKLMLHMDGTDASTTFTDSSSSANTITANGNAQIDTAVKKLGTGSGLFDGTGDFLSTPDPFALTNGNFTIDLWMYLNSTATNQTIVSQFDRYNTQNSFNFVWITTNALRFVYTTDNTNFTIKDFAWTPSTTTWYHIALVRNGADLMCFVDGTQVGSTLSMGTDSLYNCTASVYIGAQNSAPTDPNPQSYFSGQCDEFRFVVGTAVWTSNFTPPSAAYIAFGSDVVESSYSNLPLLGVG